MRRALILVLVVGLAAWWVHLLLVSRTGDRTTTWDIRFQVHEKADARRLARGAGVRVSRQVAATRYTAIAAGLSVTNEIIKEVPSALQSKTRFEEAWWVRLPVGLQGAPDGVRDYLENAAWQMSRLMNCELDDAEERGIASLRLDEMARQEAFNLWASYDTQR